MFVITILTIIYGYTGLRLISPAYFSTSWNWVLWILVLILLFTLILPIFLRKSTLGGKWIGFFAWIGYTAFALFLVTFLLLVTRDGIWLLKGGVQYVYAFSRDVLGLSVDIEGAIDPERRKVLTNTMNVGLLSLSAALTAYGFYQARRTPGIKRVSVPVENLHPDLEGFRIVQITDLHVGPTIKRDYVQSVVDQINSLSPDILAVTGDLVDGSVSDLQDDVAPLGNIKTRYGSYFVTGNHEYYSGAEQWIEELKRLGYKVLMNEHEILIHKNARLLLAGITDYKAKDFITSHKSDPEKALEGAPENDMKVLLAHQPRSVFASSKAGFDLQISGHTHGGQFFPWNLAVSYEQPYLRGLNRHESTWVYVSRGTGYWGPPLRLGFPSEITLITLTGQGT